MEVPPPRHPRASDEKAPAHNPAFKGEGPRAHGLFQRVRSRTASMCAGPHHLLSTSVSPLYTTVTAQQMGTCDPRPRKRPPVRVFVEAAFSRRPFVVKLLWGIKGSQWIFHYVGNRCSRPHVVQGSALTIKTKEGRLGGSVG